MQPSSRNEQLAVVLLHCCPGGPSSDRDGLRVPPPVTHAAESLPRQFCGGLHIDHDAGHALTVGRRHALTVRANSTAEAADNRSIGVLTASARLDCDGRRSCEDYLYLHQERPSAASRPAGGANAPSSAAWSGVVRFANKMTTDATGGEPCCPWRRHASRCQARSH